MRCFCRADMADGPVSSPSLGVPPGCTPSWSSRGMRGGLVDANRSPLGTNIPGGLQTCPQLLPSCPGPFPRPWLEFQLLPLGLVPTSHRAALQPHRVDEPGDTRGAAGGSRGTAREPEPLCPGRALNPPRGELDGNWEVGCCRHLGRPQLHSK